MTPTGCSSHMDTGGDGVIKCIEFVKLGEADYLATAVSQRATWDKRPSAAFGFGTAAPTTNEVVKGTSAHSKVHIPNTIEGYAAVSTSFKSRVFGRSELTGVKPISATSNAEPTPKSAQTKKPGKLKSWFLKSVKKKHGGVVDEDTSSNRRQVQRTMNFAPGSTFDSCFQGQMVQVVKEMPDKSVMFKKPSGDPGMLHANAFVKEADELDSLVSYTSSAPVASHPRRLSRRSRCLMWTWVDLGGLGWVLEQRAWRTRKRTVCYSLADFVMCAPTILVAVFLQEFTMFKGDKPTTAPSGQRGNTPMMRLTHAQLVDVFNDANAGKGKSDDVELSKMQFGIALKDPRLEPLLLAAKLTADDAGWLFEYMKGGDNVIKCIEFVKLGKANYLATAMSQRATTQPLAGRSSRIRD